MPEEKYLNKINSVIKSLKKTKKDTKYEYLKEQGLLNDKAIEQL